MKKTKRALEWNKVTPLSKYLTMFFFITLPFIGFILGMSLNAKTKPISDENWARTDYGYMTGLSFVYPPGWHLAKENTVLTPNEESISLGSKPIRFTIDGPSGEISIKTKNNLSNPMSYLEGELAELESFFSNPKRDFLKSESFGTIYHIEGRLSGDTLSLGKKGSLMEKYGLINGSEVVIIELKGADNNSSEVVRKIVSSFSPDLTWR